MMQFTRSDASKQAELEAAQEAARNRVTALSDEIRARYITPIAGQEMIYLAKEKEAQEYLAADPAPVDLTPYPFLAAESDATGQTPAEVATIYLSNAAHWRSVGAQLEAARMAASTAIAAAQTPAEAAQAADAFEAQVQ